MSKIKTGIKMRVTPEQSKKIQEICFENEIGWVTGRKIDYLDEPFLFIDSIISFMYEDQEEFFLESKNEEVSANLFIRTNGTCIMSQRKTLSEYLEGNNAYESFVENCVELFLNNLSYYETFKLDTPMVKLDNVFFWEDSNEGYSYWNNLYDNEPDNLIYDMDEIVFTEVDKRIAEQNPPKRYMVFVEGRSNPRKVHDSYDSAEKEARRLSAKEIGCNVSVVEIVKTFKSKVIVEEV